MNVALVALGAIIYVQSARYKRMIPIAESHSLPRTTPQIDTTLRPDELITAVELPAPVFAANSWYLKVRDRQSYAFALVSVAAGLEMNGGTSSPRDWHRVESRTDRGAQSMRKSRSWVRRLAWTRFAKQGLSGGGCQRL